MSDYMNNGAPGNVVTQQGFVVSDAIRPEYTDEELKAIIHDDKTPIFVTVDGTT